MLNQLISALGIRGARIDTRIHDINTVGGGWIQGEIAVEGGDREQVINGIALQLKTRAEVEAGDHEFNRDLILQHWPVTTAFKLSAGQRFGIPFKIQLPYETPVTQVSCRRNRSSVWLHTHLDVDWGIDAQDRDVLRVHPTPVMQAFLQAMQQCGFGLAQVDVEQGQARGAGFASSVGCYQEFEFYPQGLGMTNEVEVTFVAGPQHTHVLLEIDRKFRGDQLRSFQLDNRQTDVQMLVQQLRQFF